MSADIEAEAERLTQKFNFSTADRFRPFLPSTTNDYDYNSFACYAYLLSAMGAFETYTFQLKKKNETLQEQILRLFRQMDSVQMNDTLARLNKTRESPEVVQGPTERRKIQDAQIDPVLLVGATWGRNMSETNICETIGSKGATLLKDWKDYSDPIVGNGLASERFRQCAPDPERVAALYNMHADNWNITPINMNGVRPTRWREGPCLPTMIPKDEYMDNSRSLSQNYSEGSLPGQLAYTRLPTGKFFFTDQVFNCEIKKNSKIHPSAVIHVHTHPKWRWHEQNFTSCKIWVPANTPLYFYIHHSTVNNFAACLFAHTLEISDMYFTQEKRKRIQNVVIPKIGFYDADEVVFHPPETPLSAPRNVEVVTPGNFSFTQFQ